MKGPHTARAREVFERAPSRNKRVVNRLCAQYVVPLFKHPLCSTWLRRFAELVPQDGGVCNCSVCTCNGNVLRNSSITCGRVVEIGSS